MERWTYERPFDLVDWPDDALGTSWCWPTTSPPRTAPASCTSRPRSAPTTSRCAGSTACRWSTRSRPTATSPQDVRLVGGVFFKNADKALVAATSTRAACCSGTSPTSTPTRTAGAATRALLYYAQPSWYIRTTQVKDALLAENEKTNWFPDNDQVGPLRRLAAQQHRLGAVARRVTGARRCRSGCNDERPDPAGRASARWPSSASWPGRTCRRSTRTGRSSTTSRFTCRGVRRHVPARPRGHRRLVRLGLDAVRPVGLPARAGQRRAVRGGVPGAVHLRGDRPDPRLVLHADGRRHARARPVVVRERGLPRATSSPRTAAR